MHLLMHYFYRLLAILCLALGFEAANGATLQQLSLDQMTQSATAIVRARVTASSTSFTGKTIYTHYKLQVSETWKGSPAAEVMLAGGVAGGYRQSFPGVPQLQVGGEYVMFLWTSSSSGITHLVGLTQGLFNVATQADGTIQVSRPANADTMLDANLRPVADQAVSMGLPTMKTRVNTGVAAMHGVSK